MSLESNPIRIGIDLMGNENLPSCLVEALIDHFAGKTLSLFLIGHKDVFDTFQAPSNFQFIEAPEVIEMDDDPLIAIRKKKTSSMHKALNLIKEKKIDAIISLGNTGALVSLSIIELTTFDKISRPALLALLPTRNAPLAVLDVGAHIDCKTENFLEFAMLANAFQKVMGVENPRVGLLNIGKEQVKGSKEVKKAFNFLEKHKSTFNFIGNIEPTDIFKGEVDAILTDGFTGNILLKATEGIASLFLNELEKNQKVFQQNFFQDIKKRLDYGKYPGAVLLLGLTSLVIKCHGYSTPQAVVNAVERIEEMITNKFIDNLKIHL